MNGDEHRNEPIPQHLNLNGLDRGGMVAAQRLLLMRNPDRVPVLLFQLCNLNLVHPHPYVRELKNSDVNPDQDRLTIEASYVNRYVRRFLGHNEDPINGIATRVYDTNDQAYSLCFRQRNNGRYVITHNELAEAHWRDACQAFALRARDLIKMWILRHSETGKLCFLIHNYA